MREAISYIRWSTPDQRLGDSLRRQIAKTEAWCKAEGFRLNQSLRDEGVSGYRKRNATKGALGTFLNAVRSGEIRPGSVLIVESLDRLSRAEPLDAFDMLRDILKAGVEIVTLTDGQRYTSASMRDIGPLVTALVITSRAHEESHIKAERLGESWSQKRATALSERRPMTRQVPAWIKVEGARANGGRYDWSAAKFVLIPERAEIVRQLFEWRADGWGRRRIAQELNRRGVPVWGRGKRKARGGWQESYLLKILKSRAVLGEFQPHRLEEGRGSRRLPAGAPIPDYYPAVVSPELWHAVRAFDREARWTPGRRSVRTLLAGLVRDSSGAPMHLESKGDGDDYFATALAYRRDDRPTWRWRVDHLEQCVLMVVREIDWKRVFSAPQREPELRGLQAQLAQCDEKLSAIKKKLKAAAACLLDSDFVSLREELKNTASELKQEEGKVLEARRGIERQLIDLEAQSNASGEGGASLAAATANLKDAKMFARARRELKTLVKHVTVYPEGDVPGFPVERFRKQAAALLKGNQGLLARQTGRVCGAFVIEYANSQKLTVFVTYRQRARTSAAPTILAAAGAGYTQVNREAASRHLKSGCAA